MKKMKKLLFKKNSIILTWLFSYLIIIVFSIIVISIQYIAMHGRIRQDVNDLNDYMLEQKYLQFEAMLNEVVDLSSQIVTNATIQKIANTSNPDNYEKYDIVRISQDLNSYHAANRNIDSCFIYFKDINTVVSASSITNSEVFYEVNHKVPDIDYEGWMDTISKSGSDQYINMYRTNATGQPVSSIAFLRSFPVSQSEDKKAVAVVLIDKSRFMKTVQDIIEINNANLLILDEKENILFSTNGNDFEGNLNYSDFVGSKSSQTIDVGNVKFVVSYLSSNIAKWKYVIAIPSNIYWIKLRSVQFLMFTGIFILLAGGFFITYILVRKNYSPMNDLINALQNHKPDGHTKNGVNEYNFIKETFKSILTDNEAMKDIVSQRSEILKDNFITRLLKGMVKSEDSVDALFDSFEDKLVSDYFAVALFHIEDLHLLFKESTSMTVLEKEKTMQFIMKNVLEEISGRSDVGYVVEIDNNVACLFNIREENIQNYQALIKQVILDAREFIKKHFMVSFTSAISSIHTSMQGINEAYCEASSALEYRIIYAKDDIIDFDEISKISKHEFYYPLQKEQHLINCIKAGDTVNADLILDEFFENNIGSASSNISLYTAKCLMFNLISTILKLSSEITINDEHLVTQLDLKVLFDCGTIFEMKCKVTEILHNFCKGISISDEAANASLINKAIEFIDKNYKDMNLSITMLADYFGVSSRLISKLFKDQTGERIIDYINKVRIKKIKQLIEEQDINLEHGAKLVGFYSFRTFMRIFKEHEGITPGKFKETNKKNKLNM